MFALFHWVFLIVIVTILLLEPLDVSIKTGASFVQICWAAYLSLSALVPHKPKNVLLAAAYLVLVIASGGYLVTVNIRDQAWVGAAAAVLLSLAYLGAHMFAVFGAGRIVANLGSSEDNQKLWYRIGLSVGIPLFVAGTVVGSMALGTRGRWLDPFSYFTLFAAIHATIAAVVLMGNIIPQRIAADFRGIVGRPSLLFTFGWLATLVALSALAEYEFRKNWLMFATSTVAICFSAMAIVCILLQSPEANWARGEEGRQR